MGASESLPDRFVHFLFNFGKVKKQMQKIGSEKSAPHCLFDRGGGGVYAHGKNTFRKGASQSEKGGNLCHGIPPASNLKHR